jgi:hypothetical protein
VPQTKVNECVEAIYHVAGHGRVNLAQEAIARVRRDLKSADIPLMKALPLQTEAADVRVDHHPLLQGPDEKTQRKVLRIE